MHRGGLMLQTFGKYAFGRDGGNTVQSALNKQKGRIAARPGSIPRSGVHSLAFDQLTYQQCRLVVKGKLAPFLVGNPFKSLVDLDKKNAAAYLVEHRQEANLAFGRRSLSLSEPALP